jgi:hypothetical protein
LSINIFGFLIQAYCISLGFRDTFDPAACLDFDPGILPCLIQFIFHETGTTLYTFICGLARKSDGMAAGKIRFFDNLDRNIKVRQLQGGRKACHATAENDHSLVRHLV